MKTKQNYTFEELFKAVLRMYELRSQNIIAINVIAFQEQYLDITGECLCYKEIYDKIKIILADDYEYLIDDPKDFDLLVLKK